MEAHMRAKSFSEPPWKAVVQYPWGAMFGAHLIADVSFSGVSLWFSFYLSAWSHSARTGCFLLSSLLCWERGVAVVGTIAKCHRCVIFAVSRCGPPAMWQGTWGVLLRLSQGKGVTVRTRFNVSFLYSVSKATGILAHSIPLPYRTQTHSGSLTCMLAHWWCGGKYKAG